ncbi:MAG: FCD domain-containing protein [Actinomycetota bacterium]|nr:FCD domain-containing protein [Actinomycetota bacterium]
METIWQPIKDSGHLTEKIVARIEQIIEESQLSAGSRLPSERELAKLLGVSRPALREAVKTLEAHGRVVVRHGQGVFITASADELMRDRLANQEVSMMELYAMRNVLEAPAAGWAAANASDHDIERLRLALEAEEEARTNTTDFARLAQLDSGFHLLIVEIARNRFLLQTLGILQEMMAAGMDTTLTVPGRLERSRQDHRAIFEAIRDHDIEAARVAASSHIIGAREAALSRVRGSSADDI